MPDGHIDRMLVVCNYIIDSLPADAFLVRSGRLHVGTVRTTLSPPVRQQRGDGDVSDEYEYDSEFDSPRSEPGRASNGKWFHTTLFPLARSYVCSMCCEWCRLVVVVCAMALYRWSCRSARVSL